MLKISQSCGVGDCAEWFSTAPNAIFIACFGLFSANNRRLFSPIASTLSGELASALSTKRLKVKI
jgi:hypothetical protein